MTTTGESWIDQTRDMLLSGYVEELLQLASSVTVDATTLSITGASSSGIATGVVIEIDIEAMYVTSVTGTEVSVIRGYGGSSPKTHSQSDIVRVSPKFPAYRIMDALNDDLRDLSTPDNGVYQIKTTSFVYNAAQDGYNLVGLTSEDVQSIYSVTYEFKVQTPNSNFKLLRIVFAL